MSETLKTAAQAAGESTEQKIARLERELAAALKAKSENLIGPAAIKCVAQECLEICMELGRLKRASAEECAKAIAKEFEL